MSPLDRAGKPITILMADDDEEDCELIREALQDAGLADSMKFVHDGQELLDYLRHAGPYADPSVDAPRPGIILLDLNMPKKDGREALTEIKSDDSLRRIPVVVMTTSADEQDMLDVYDLGASSFITKPVSFAALVEVMAGWRRYWFDVVELPRGALDDDVK